MPGQTTNQKKTFHSKKKSMPKVNKNVRRYVNSTVKRVISSEAEHKYHFDGSAGVTPGVTGTVFPLIDAITQGTSDLQRIGDKIRVGSLRMNFTWTRNPASAESATQCRLIIFQWADSDQVGLTSGDILQNNTFPTLSVLRHDPLRSKTMLLLYDKTFLVDADDPVVSGSLVISPKRKNVQYDNGGPVGTGKYFMYLGSNDSFAIPSFAYFFKVNYTDA